MACFDKDEEQLYLFEILIENLNLNEEKIHECGDNRVLLIKVKFLSLPILEIKHNNLEYTNINEYNKSIENTENLVAYSSGRSCLFGKKPGDLVDEMQENPLKIGIFCVGDTFPLVQLSQPLSGCFCDQVTMASNDTNHLPKPYILNGRFGLLDPGENPSGSITFELKITCLGKYITTYYQIKDNSFVFKSDRDEGQYIIKRVTNENKNEKNSNTSEEISQQFSQDQSISK